MKLYRFDGVTETLELVPLSARRLLDGAGLKLSLSGWQSLPQAIREELARRGSGAQVQTEGLAALIEGAEPAPVEVESLVEPDPSEPPPELLAALGVERPVPGAAWSALSPLDRYALVKVASRKNPERLSGAYTELVGHSASSTHLMPEGGVRMVDVSAKTTTVRHAVAESTVSIGEVAFDKLTHSQVPKGDVFATARVAGILAAKRTWDLIPLCHPLQLSKIQIDLEALSGERKVRIVATVETVGRTGVEMEALVAASTAALTVYDMLKAFDRGMVIGPTQLQHKSGGRSGDYNRD